MGDFLNSRMFPPHWQIAEIEAKHRIRVVSRKINFSGWKCNLHKESRRKKDRFLKTISKNQKQ